MGITLDQILLDASTSNIAISDGTDVLAINGDGSLNAVVTATDLDIRDLTHVSDSVKVGDGTDFLAIAADGSIAVTDNGTTLSIDDGAGSITVDAVDLDIRDLANATDHVAIGDESNLVDMAIMDSAFGITSAGFPIMGIRQDAAGSPVSADGDAHPLVFNSDGELKVAADLTSSIADDAVDSGNPIKVGGRGVSGALSALSASGDRFDLLGDLYRRVWVNDSANIAISTVAATVTTTAAEVLGTPLGGRRSVNIQNLGSQSVFLVESGATAKTLGTEIPKNSSADFKFGEDINIFLVADSGSQDVRLLELA